MPEEGWPPEWVKNGPRCRRQCCRLIQALYGHPDFGSSWEKRVHKKLLQLGFELAAESWPSVYLHHATGLMLVLDVDDFLMAGPEENTGPMWDRIGKALKIDEVGPMALYLGLYMKKARLRCAMAGTYVIAPSTRWISSKKRFRSI